MQLQLTAMTLKVHEGTFNSYSTSRLSETLENGAFAKVSMRIHRLML